MNLAEGYERRFGVALGISVVVHIGAMALSLPAPRVPAFDAPIPLSVRLVQEPLAAVVELVRPARPAVSKPTHAKHPPPKHEEARPAPSPVPQPLPPIAASQAVPPIDETPTAAPEPADPPPVAGTLLPTPEAVALVAPAPPQRGPSAELLALYTKSLSELFARYKEYPQIAQLRGWEGSVTMRLRVAPSGRLIGAEVLKSSGYDALDKQAMTMVTRVGMLPVPPQGLNAAEVPVLVPINFRLEH
jgi:protein TonB